MERAGYYQACSDVLWLINELGDLDEVARAIAEQARRIDGQCEN